MARAKSTTRRPPSAWEQSDDSADDAPPQRLAGRAGLDVSHDEDGDEDRSEDASGLRSEDGTDGLDNDDGESNASGSQGATSDSATSVAEAKAEEEGPGFAQYLDSEEEAANGEIGLSDSSDEQGDAGVSKATAQTRRPETDEDAIRERMEKVPFATLLKARNSMRGRGGVSDDEMFDKGSEEDEFEADRRNASTSEQKRAQARHELEKRESKHAPTEMSTRKPVSRRRNVVETPSTQRRDPRFSSLSASQANAGLFENSYGFLREQQTSEVSELRKIHKQLRRQEAHHAGPRAKSEVALKIREERERIEQALRREEGRENERQRRERETAVLRREKRAIDERVKQGGKRYFLKDSEKKRLVLQDKFERLAHGGASSNGASGGGAAAGGSREKPADGQTGTGKRGALQRAIERRRKKNAARDRRMPLGGGAGGSVVLGDGSLPPSAVPKRKRMAVGGATSKPPHKRGRRG